MNMESEQNRTALAAEYFQTLISAADLHAELEALAEEVYIKGNADKTIELNEVNERLNNLCVSLLQMRESLTAYVRRDTTNYSPPWEGLRGGAS